MKMSNPKVSKNVFKQTGLAWTDYYKDNKFEALDEVDASLKYIPVYYQKKSVTAMAAAYATWNGVNQRFEIFCPASPIFRAANLHERGHIYFGHLRNSRKYILIAKEMIKNHEWAIEKKFGLGDRRDIEKDILNICMDFEINSKLFRTPKEREELNASVNFYLRRLKTKLELDDYNPELLSKETVIYFPEDFGLPGKKSFLEYVQIICDIAEDNYTFTKQSSPFEENNSSFAGCSVSLPSDDNEGENNPSEEENETPSFGETSEENNATSSNGISQDNSDAENEETEDNDSFETEGSGDSPSEKSVEENNETENEAEKAEDKSSSNSAEDTTVDQDEAISNFKDKLRRNITTDDKADDIKRHDRHLGSTRNSYSIYDEVSGDDIDAEINKIEYWNDRHKREEYEIEVISKKIEVAASKKEITDFIMNNALPTITETRYNDMLYNYNRGKTKDVFINKSRTRSEFKKPSIHIFTDISGSMDAEYTKTVVKSLKVISSRIDNKSSITFYNGRAQNTEKLATLTDKCINDSFTGGGTDLSYALKDYVSSKENISANTVVIISDFDDNFGAIKKKFNDIKARIICIEVCQPIYRSELTEGIESNDIKNVRTMKVVDRKFAA